jgi:hypothetical protein
VYDTALCVVCSHFASGEGEGDAEKRNADFHEATKRLSFAPAPSTAAVYANLATTPRVLSDHAAVLWLGDLNYRLRLSDDAARAAIATADW